MKYTPEDIPLAATVGHIVPLFASHAEQKQITLHQSIPDTLTVYADPNMLNTVIRNLVANALKFTEVGGSIEIAAQQKAQYVEISVTDTGVGIPEEHLPDLFRIDVKVSTPGTAGERGTGLGLPLCRDLIEKNGGTIEVESEPGKGTTFRFTLPIFTFSSASSPKRQDMAESDQQTGEETSLYPADSTILVKDLNELAEAVALLPREWQTALQSAVEGLDIKGVKDIIEQIDQQDKSLAKALGRLVEQYRFDFLQKIVEEIGISKSIESSC
jgi:anti-sigma regulatory factor (Ser/Thr protein kinase)